MLELVGQGERQITYVAAIAAGIVVVPGITVKEDAAEEDEEVVLGA